MYTKKQSFILIILLAVLAGGVFLYRGIYSQWPWSREVALISPTASPDASKWVAESGTTRTKTMDVITSLIGDIALSENASVERFWFVQGSDNDFYVEYSADGVLSRALLKTNQEGERTNYEILARFAPGENDWSLKSGKDEQAGKNLDLYEWEEGQNAWMKKN